MPGILSKYSCFISSFSVGSGFQQHKSYIYVLLTHRACTEQVPSSVSGGAWQDQSRGGTVLPQPVNGSAGSRLVHFPLRMEEIVGSLKQSEQGWVWGWGGGFVGAPPPRGDCRGSVLLFASVDLGCEQSPAHPSTLAGAGPLPPAVVGPWPICTTSFGEGFNPPLATRLLHPPVLMLPPGMEEHQDQSRVVLVSRGHWGRWLCPGRQRAWEHDTAPGPAVAFSSKISPDELF